MRLFFNWVGIFLFIGMCYGVCGGVTYKGQHHGVSCSCSKGVGIE